MQSLVLLCLLSLLGASCADVTLDKILPIEGEVTTIKTGSDNKVHVVTGDFIYYRYDPATGEAITYNCTNEVYSVTLDHNGNAFLLVKNKIYDYIFTVLKADSSTVEQWWRDTYIYSPESDGIFVDNQNYLYLADDSGVYIVRENGTRSQIKGVQNMMKHYVLDNEGNVYLKTGKKVLDPDEVMTVLYPEEKDKATPAVRVVNGISDSYYEPISDSAEDSHNNIFFGIVGSQTSLKKLTADGDVLYLLTQGVNLVAVDHKDTVYATTWGFGKPINLYFIPYESTFPVLVANLTDINKDFVDIKIDSSNNAYFATAESAIYLLPEGDVGNVIKISKFPSIQPIRNIVFDNNETLYILGEDLFSVAKGEVAATRVARLPAGDKYLAVGADNTVYVGTVEGLFALRSS